jgi:hypothetical protein
MDGVIKTLHRLVIEFYQGDCIEDCNNCPLGKKYNEDTYEDKTMCDILNDLNDYLERNEL